MAARQMLAVVIALVVIITIATPAIAEGLEPTTIILIAGAAVTVIAVVAVVIIANVVERRRVDQERPDGPPMVVALRVPTTESP
jgi:membrane protein YdbS with pleckstrin-like domain